MKNSDELFDKLKEWCYAGFWLDTDGDLWAATDDERDNFSYLSLSSLADSMWSWVGGDGLTRDQVAAALRGLGVHVDSDGDFWAATTSGDDVDDGKEGPHEWFSSAQLADALGHVVRAPAPTPSSDWASVKGVELEVVKRALVRALDELDVSINDRAQIHVCKGTAHERSPLGLSEFATHLWSAFPASQVLSGPAEAASDLSDADRRVVCAALRAYARDLGADDDRRRAYELERRLRGG